MKKYKKGLVVGKFCPLTVGHEYLINTAIEQCEEVLIISYTSEPLGYSAKIRAQWLRHMFTSTQRVVFEADQCPKDDAPAKVHRQFCKQVCDVANFLPNAVFTSEEYGDGFVEYLNRNWILHDEIVHVCVDILREVHPISGTTMREYNHLPVTWSKYASPYVNMTRAKRVLMIGGESSGKSTLCAALGGSYDHPFPGALIVKEYGRTLWEETGGVGLGPDDMVTIAKTQITHEKEACSQTDKRFVFCDTSPLVTCYYSQMLYGEVLPDLLDLKHRRYDYVFMCERDFDFVDDGTRFGAENSDKQREWYAKELKQPFISLRGSVRDRIKTVQQHLLRDMI